MRASLIGLVAVVLVAVSLTDAFVPPSRSEAYESFQPAIERRHHLNFDLSGAAVPLTLGSDSSVDAAIDHLRNTTCPGTQWAVSRTYRSRSNGVTHVYLTQTYNGREISNSFANVNFDARGRILNVGESCLPGLDDIRTFMPDLPRITAVEALNMVVNRLSLVSVDGSAARIEIVDQSSSGERYVLRTNVLPDQDGDGSEDVTVELRYIVDESSQLLPQLTWHMVLPLSDNWFDIHVLASSDAKVISMIDWVAWDSYEAYAIPSLDPLLGSRSVQVDPAYKTSSPYGWLDQRTQSQLFTTTVGNNALVQLNPTGAASFIYNFRPDGGVARAFNYSIDFFAEPYQYKEATVANLFYWNNLIHDIFYAYGFTEEAGNFQETNFGKGGLGNDAVQANAQDGSGYNNANMATPPDGQRPRMRMYLWNWSSPMKDGDLDSGIIVHEYGHGISIRLTGGPANSNCLNNGQPGGMGEGWGDFWATMFIQRKEFVPGDAFPMGAYAAGRGIRPFPYSADFKLDPQTFGYINQAGYNLPSNVHAKGSVWCTILIEVYWELVSKHGFDPDWFAGTGGNNALFRNVVDGLKLQPCNPLFTDARDAIILADGQNHGGRFVCDMWAAFARRGLGYSANAKSSPVVEAFDLPPQCTA